MNNLDTILMNYGTYQNRLNYINGLEYEIKEAQKKAEEAQKKAEEAQKKAEEAQKKAEEAQTKAEEANDHIEYLRKVALHVERDIKFEEDTKSIENQYDRSNNYIEKAECTIEKCEVYCRYINEILEEAKKKATNSALPYSTFGELEKKAEKAENDLQEAKDHLDYLNSSKLEKYIIDLKFAEEKANERNILSIEAEKDVEKAEKDTELDEETYQKNLKKTRQIAMRALEYKKSSQEDVDFLKFLIEQEKLKF